MTRWEPDKLEYITWRVEHLMRHLQVRNLPEMFIKTHPNRDETEARCHCIRYEVRLMVGEGELPDYVNVAYFALPEKERFLATTD